MKRILLVDDNEAFRKPLSEALELAGYKVQEARDGVVAMRLYAQELFDLVVTDLIMPGKEGLETIMEIRRLRPQQKIIAISGGGRMDPTDYLTMAKYLGAAETLTKPFGATEILEAVARVLGSTTSLPAY